MHSHRQQVIWWLLRWESKVFNRLSVFSRRVFVPCLAGIQMKPEILYSFGPRQPGSPTELAKVRYSPVEDHCLVLGSIYSKTYFSAQSTQVSSCFPRLKTTWFAFRGTAYAAVKQRTWGVVLCKASALVDADQDKEESKDIFLRNISSNSSFLLKYSFNSHTESCS